MDADEVWLPVVGYEGSYEVSSKGRVRSIDRTISYRDGRKPRHFKGQVLSQKFTAHYYRLRLSKSGKTLTWTVHHLVCEAFHGPRPPGLVVRHLNGQHRDNRAENLCWGTYAENTADMVRHGNAYWSNQTHCIHGHEFTEANTRVVIRPHGGIQRNCRECKRISTRERKARERQQRLAQRPIHTCVVCGKGFPTSYRQARVCSAECKRASRRVEFTRRRRRAA